MTAMIQDREALALTEYRPQGMGHILKLCAITTAGMVLVSMGGSVIFAAPLALATVYGMFKGSNKAQDPNWCEARDEIWHYKLSPKHRSLADDYSDWCKEWGTHTVNQLIEPMIGQCAIANFTKDKKHPYYGLRGVLIYDHDDDDLPPLAPWDYVNFRLEERKELLQKRETEAIEVTAQTVPLDAIAGTATLENNPKGVYKFLVSLTQAPLQPVIIAGLPGSGKGILAAMALSIGVRENGLRFWLFNCKPKLEEAGYWAKCDRHYLKNRLQDDENLFDDLMEVLEEFGSEGTRRNDTPGQHQPFVLLIEEVNALTGLLTPKQRQLFKAKVTALASLLRGCNMALWLSGQSVTLEDLGMTGKSNRSMFTAIVAVGTNNRESLSSLCQPLGIPFDESQLNQNTRYWLTSTGYSQALDAPANIPQYPNWSSVPNLIDLRPGALPSANDDGFGDVEGLLADVQLQEGEIQEKRSQSQLKGLQKALKLRDEDVAEIDRQRLEDSYKKNAPDEFAIAPQNDSQSIENSLSDPLDDVARYITSKGGELPVSALKNWGKTRRKGSLDSEAIEESLIELMNLQLIETFTPADSKGEWVRWIATR